MKTCICPILLSLATVQSFAPNPSFGGRRPPLVQYKNAAPLTPQFATDKEESAFATIDKSEVRTSQKNGETNVEVKNEEEKELTETEKLMKKVKESGTAGVVSYALWELAFWAFSVPVCIFGYREVTGYVHSFFLEPFDLSTTIPDIYFFVIVATGPTFPTRRTCKSLEPKLLRL